MLNLRFSVEKNREISSTEARVGSIRRRLIDPLGRRRNSLVATGLSTKALEHSTAMPEKRSKRKEVNLDWEPDGGDDSHSNTTNSRGISTSRAAGNGENCSISNENGYAVKHNSRERSRRGEESSSTQQKNRGALGPCRQAMGTALQDMGAAQKAVESLQKILKLHVDDLESIDETKKSLHQLEEECREKDGKLLDSEITIKTLTSINEKAEANNKEEAERIKKARQELEQGEERQMKRVITATAEEKLKLKHEFDERTRNQNNAYEMRMKELENEFTQKNAETGSKIAALNANVEQLSAVQEKMRMKMKSQADELEKVNEDNDVLKRAKASIRTDMLAREKELDMLKSEFALNSKSVEYFQQQFTEIYGEIEAISMRYFHDIEDKNLDDVHKKLAAVDSCFKFFLIDDTDDSRDLRTAHAQRIISKAICEDIWKPFRSELTLSSPELSDLLSKISDELEKPSYGRRTANVWAALTMRALQNLPTSAMNPANTNSNQNLLPTGLATTSSVISKVSILFPIVNSSKIDSLREDLCKLVHMSIGLWNDAYAGGLKMHVSTLLDRADRDQWRCQQFDPVLSPLGLDGTDTEPIFNTRPRIFTLFPRVMAWPEVDLAKQDKAPPGSWPPELKPVCIHFGRGLPEWSPLVVRGKDAKDEKDELFEIAMEKFKKELNSSRRSQGHGRRASKGSSISVPMSPSNQWKMEGAMKPIE